MTTSDGGDITGGGNGARVVSTGAPVLDKKTFDRWFNPDVFARPARSDFGSAPKDVFRQPGTNNHDISFFKRIPIKSEKRSLQLRWEFYNAFNHTQFSGTDNTIRFDGTAASPTFGKNINTRFGQVISTRAPRRMQGSLRFSF